MLNMSDGYTSPVDLGLSAPTSPKAPVKEIINLEPLNIDDKREDPIGTIECESHIKIVYEPKDNHIEVVNDHVDTVTRCYRKMSYDVILSDKIKICKEESFSINTDKPQNDLKIELSNCWSQIAKSNENLEQLFYKNMIQKEDFFKDPQKIITNNNLAIRYMDHVYPWKVMAPILVANAAYGQELPADVLSNLTQQQLGFFIWKKIDLDAFKIDIKKSKTSKSVLVNSPKQLEIVKRPSIVKTYHPTSDQIKLLNLEFGRNEISFTVNSRYQGAQTIITDIYLWNYDDKIVISDLDGTITRSDVLGHIFPMFGKDWSHKGVVKLYNDIVKNGYKILYLTARAICQSDQTKFYLREKLIQSNPSLISRQFQTTYRSNLNFTRWFNFKFQARGYRSYTTEF
jgi:hypothetical protein